MNAKHTPGPWQIDECPDANGFETIRQFDGTDNGDLNTQPIATVYNPSHSRLIAAAPALLAALEECLGFMDRVLEGHSIGDIQTENQARAAIAQAKGEQP